MRSRIYQWHGELREMGEALARADAYPSLESIQGPTGLGTCLHRLAFIKAKVDGLDIPLAFANELYTLRMHIERVRTGLADARETRRTEQPGTRDSVDHPYRTVTVG